MDRRSRVLVTGATGQVGAQLCQELSTRFRDRIHITAGVHATSALRGRSDVWQGAERTLIFEADKAESLDLHGIEMLCLIPDSSKDRVAHSEALLKAALKHGVVFVLLISGLHGGSDVSTETQFTEQFAQIEALVQRSGMRHAVLRLGFFQQNFFLHADEVAQQHCISLPLLHGRLAPLNVIDAACMAAIMLNHPGQHVGNTYTLVGPELLDAEGIAVAASRGLGRTIRVQTISLDAYRDFLCAQEGMTKWQADGLVDMMRQAREDRLRGVFSHAFYERHTKAEGTRLEDFFRMNAVEFAPAKAERSGAAMAAMPAVVSGAAVPVPVSGAAMPTPTPTPTPASMPVQAREAKDAPLGAARGNGNGAAKADFAKLVRVVQALWDGYRPATAQLEPGMREAAPLLEDLVRTCDVKPGEQPQRQQRPERAGEPAGGAAGAKARAEASSGAGKPSTSQAERSGHAPPAQQQQRAEAPAPAKAAVEPTSRESQEWHDVAPGAAAPASSMEEAREGSGVCAMPADEIRSGALPRGEDEPEHPKGFLKRTTEKVASVFSAKPEHRRTGPAVEATHTGETRVFGPGSASS